MNQTPAYIRQAQARLLFLTLCLFTIITTLGIRLADLTIVKYQPTSLEAELTTEETTNFKKRADITDAQGVVLATSLGTASLYADPADILDIQEAAQKISCVLPDLSAKEIETKLKVQTKRFVWLYRHLTPRQHQALHELGLPGLHFERTEKRVYLHKSLFSHTVGYTDVDNRGIAGIENSFDANLRENDAPLALSLDIRLQYALAEELDATVKTHRALGGMGTVMDAQTGEIKAMISLPDFDPNAPTQVKPQQRFNGNTAGVYELGSGLKLLTAAMALDAGKVNFTSCYDATNPIQVGRQLIHDYKGQKRVLNVPEIIVYSSNIGAAKMAMDVGARQQQIFLKKCGLLTPTRIELPEVSRPLFPSPTNWKDVNTMTIAFGHGLAVSPVQMLSAIAAMVNGGIYMPATLLKRGIQDKPQGERIISAKTSNQICRLMRAVVLEGTGRKAAVPGYVVAGKSGTAEKIKGGKYSKTANMSSFIGTFPAHKPEYVIFVMVDEPHGTKETHGYATGGWIAAPLAGRIIKRIAPILGVAPVDENAEEILKATSIPKKTDLEKDFHLASQSTR